MQSNRRGSAIAIDGRSAAIRVLAVCLLIEVGLVLLDYFVNYGGLTDSSAVRRMANIAREDAIASWFSSTQTLLVGLTAWLFWLGARADKERRWRRAGWCVVAILFTYMAVDDAAQVHERIGAASREWLDAESFPTYMWHLVMVPFFALAGAFSVVFLWRELNERQQAWLLVAGFGMFGFAVGLDFFEGLDPDHAWNVYAASLAGSNRAALEPAQYETLLHFSRAIEEFAEMFGTTLIWTSLLMNTPALPAITFDGVVERGVASVNPEPSPVPAERRLKAS